MLAVGVSSSHDSGASARPSCYSGPPLRRTHRVASTASAPTRLPGRRPPDVFGAVPAADDDERVTLPESAPHPGHRGPGPVAWCDLRFVLAHAAPSQRVSIDRPSPQRRIRIRSARVRAGCTTGASTPPCRGRRRPVAGGVVGYLVARPEVVPAAPSRPPQLLPPFRPPRTPSTGPAPTGPRRRPDRRSRTGPATPTGPPCRRDGRSPSRRGRAVGGVGGDRLSILDADSHQAGLPGGCPR